VIYSSLLNMGPGCYKLRLLTLDVFVNATSWGAPVPHGLALLGGSDTIYNNPEESANHIWAITQND
jgi:hypothetical protein